MVARDVPDAAWVAGAVYPSTICRYGFAETATHLYVFGGVSNGTPVNSVNRMDIASGTWQPRAPMPFTGEAPTCALMASTGIVYCAEGLSGGGFASYNTATDTWTPLAGIPGGDHYGSASGAFNGRVFVACGTSSISNAVQVYNVATNTWSAGTAAPSSFLFAGYQQVGQYLYIVGGFSSGGTSSIGGVPSSVLYRGQQPQAPSANITTTARLDMSSAPGAWSAGPAFTQGRADFALASSGSKLVAIGGDSTGGGFFDSSTQVDEMDTTAWPGGAWVASPDNLPSVRQANQAGFSSTGKIWSTGGLVGSTFEFLNENLSRATGCAPIVINGSIAASDPTQVDRLFRSGIPQTCPASTSCATFGDLTPRHYDSYTFTNTTGSPQCLMIDTNTACTGTNFVFIAAYLGSFDPNNICTNWIGDSGGSPNPDQPFSVNLAAGQTVVVVVSEVTPNAGCPDYTLTVTGLCGGPPPPPVCNYTISGGTNPIVPGVTNINNHCDDCDTSVALPFPFTLYDQSFNSVNVSSNGRLDFVVANEPGGFQTSCLPAPPNIGPYDYTIFGLWHDQRTDIGLPGCAGFPGGQCGVFTSVSGSAPNRVFNVGVSHGAF